MKEAERARGRKGMRETIAEEILYTCHSFTCIYYSCGGKVLMDGVPESFSAQKKKVLTGSRWNGEGLEELFPRFTLLSEDFAAASIFYLLLLSALIFIFLFILFTLPPLRSLWSLYILHLWMKRSFKCINCGILFADKLMAPSELMRTICRCI